MSATLHPSSFHPGDECEGSEANKSAASALAAGLRQLADQLEGAPQPLVSAASDILAADFIQHRLPPHPAQLPDKGGGVGDSSTRREAGELLCWQSGRAARGAGGGAYLS
jgi:hypothetical protein